MTKQQIEALKKITTGKWKVDVSENFGKNWPITTGTSSIDGKVYHVCTDGVRASELSGDAKTDAIAIAALPDLLAEREKMIAGLTRISNLDPPSSACGNDPAKCSFECVGCAARAVLAEIEGSE